MQIRRIIHKQLGELLIERGVITRDNLAEALSVQKEKGGLLGEIFLSLKYAKEEDIVNALTNQYGFPYLPLINYEIDQGVIKLIPEKIARQYNLVPLDKIGNNLTITMSNPLNLQAIEDVEAITGCKVQTFLSTASDILAAIDKYYTPERK